MGFSPESAPDVYRTTASFADRKQGVADVRRIISQGIEERLPW